MALSRLRHPLVSRASSLYMARLSSSSSIIFTSRSISPDCRVQNLIDVGGSSIRPISSFLFSGFQNYTSKYKSQSGVRCLSTGELASHTFIGLPALSPTMSQGNIAKWRKKEGDKIEVGDVLCEIETDKATLEFESLEEGYLARILVPEGSKDVPVGQPIAITVEEVEDIHNVPLNLSNGQDIKDNNSTEKRYGDESRSEKASPEKIRPSELPPHVVIGMPALSPTMNQGNIARWRKKEGDKIGVGEVICEIETDKASLEFESLEEGFLAKILAPEGSKDILVGKPIAVTVEDENDIEIIKANFTGDLPVSEGEQPSNTKHVERKQTAGFSRISPSAKLLISEHGLDASLLQATGPHGTLLKGDVLSAIKLGKTLPKKSSLNKNMPSSNQVHLQTQSPAKPAPQQSESYEDQPNSQIRKVIARRLLESKHNTPHLYLSSDVRLDPLLLFRKELKEKYDVKVSVNDVIIKIVAIALRDVPESNAYWNAEKEEVVLCDSVDISIAVATDKGLMTPIIRSADQKSIASISSEVKQLAERARAGKLAPNEFQGGTFSISNLGMFPVDNFCAIINPPQAGILAVGRGNQSVEPVIGSDGIEKPAIITKMNLTLSADHRVFDRRVGGAFLAALNSNFSDIRRLLL